MALLTNLGRVGQHRTVIEQIPAITAGAYTAGDAFGGLLTFTGASHGPGHSGMIEGMRLVCHTDAVTPDVDLVFFDTTFTPIADNVVWSLSDAIMDTAIGHVSIVSADHYITGGGAVNSVAFAPAAVPFITLTTNTIWGQMVIQSGSTFVATTDVEIRVSFRRD